MRGRIDILGRRLAFFVEKVPDVRTVGIINETEDCMFFPVIDYDNKSLDAVMKDLYRLHCLFGLCTFIVFENSSEYIENEEGGKVLVGNYGVIGIDKLSFHEHYRMLGQTRCDPRFREINSKKGWPHGNWVLRICEKERSGQTLKKAPKIICIKRFKGKCPFTHSTAIVDFISVWGGLAASGHGPLECGNMDGLESLTMVRYGTTGKGVKAWQKNTLKA